ncbi:transposase [Pantoea rwandensis]|uniref:transposase n=1 Tax=unclassified Pantoea TaxID=2630326 RepID=UPI001CD5BAA0|nr:transposase [Pantoea sp. alder69]MCA1249202.1 transposase [Pantoea sp. alder70]MCA1264723.1 transposase [Pantoea sp. alder81]
MGLVQCVKLRLNFSGKPTQSEFIENFNDRFPYEYLNEQSFNDVLNARKIVNDLVQIYNESQFHLWLNY